MRHPVLIIKVLNKLIRGAAENFSQARRRTRKPHSTKSDRNQMKLFQKKIQTITPHC